MEVDVDTINVDVYETDGPGVPVHMEQNETANWPHSFNNFDPADTYGFRITHDGGELRVLMQRSAAEPAEPSGGPATQRLFDRIGIDDRGGMIGFAATLSELIVILPKS